MRTLTRHALARKGVRLKVKAAQKRTGCGKASRQQLAFSRWANSQIKGERSATRGASSTKTHNASTLRMLPAPRVGSYPWSLEARIKLCVAVVVIVVGFIVIRLVGVGEIGFGGIGYQRRAGLSAAHLQLDGVPNVRSCVSRRCDGKVASQKRRKNVSI